MGNAGTLLSIITFMLFFNGLMGLYALSDTGTDNDFSFPALPDDPDALDYIIYPFKWVGTIFELTFFTISELPIWLLPIIISVDIVLGYIIISLIRGGS